MQCASHFLANPHVGHSSRAKNVVASRVLCVWKNRFTVNSLGNDYCWYYRSLCYCSMNFNFHRKKRKEKNSLLLFHSKTLNSKTMSRNSTPTLRIETFLAYWTFNTKFLSQYRSFHSIETISSCNMSYPDWIHWCMNVKRQETFSWMHSTTQ